MEIFAQSDIGLVRHNNEDACRFGTLSDNTAWSVVCDGMGGANAGNVASTVAAETVEKLLNKGYQPNFNDDQTVDFLTDIVQKANSKVYKMQRDDEALSGMGTTLELVLATTTSHRSISYRCLRYGRTKKEISGASGKG